MVLRDNAIIQPPIKPKEIAENYGVTVIFAEFPDAMSSVMGFYDWKSQSIFVNEVDPPNRQTFTIAHEFGHHLLHRDYLLQHPEQYRVLMRQPLGGEKLPLEQEANAFAANLLVPRKLLVEYAKVASQAELARLFIVSEEVIRWRMITEKLLEAA